MPTTREKVRTWMAHTPHRKIAASIDLAWRIRRNTLGIMASPMVLHRARRIPMDPDIDQMVLQVTGRRFFGVIHAMQMHTEIRRLLEAIRALRPRRLLEIGTARGGTLFMTSRVADPEALLISLDLPGGMFGGGYPRWKSAIYRGMVLPRQRVELIRADSHLPTSLEQVRSLLKGELLDYLFIDGDHTYEGVKRDFDMYAPLVREGGLIAFHDIADHPEAAGGDVPRFWQDIKAGRNAEEFVEIPNGGCGIGVLRV